MGEQLIHGKPLGRYTLIDALAATNDGVWVDVSGFKDFTLHVDGITTATVQWHGSNKATLPANTDDDSQIGVDITADGLYQAPGPFKWMKASISAWTSGTISAFLEAV